MNKKMPSRASPSVSATGFAPGTTLVGNDGTEWEVGETSSGVRRWRRRQDGHGHATTSAFAGTVFVRAVLPIVLDDRLGARSVSAGRGLSHATVVPEAARATVRRMVRDNVFGFESLLTEVPLRRSSTDRGAWFLWGRRKGHHRKAAAAALASVRLVEGARGGWAMALEWVLPSVESASDVDIAALTGELEGQLSDGWGEGVEQFRFGELVICDDEEGKGSCRRARRGEAAGLDEDVDGRYSFNLTTVGAAALRSSASTSTSTSTSTSASKHKT